MHLHKERGNKIYMPCGCRAGSDVALALALLPEVRRTTLLGPVTANALLWRFSTAAKIAAQLLWFMTSYATSCCHATDGKGNQAIWWYGGSGWLQVQVWYANKALWAGFWFFGGVKYPKKRWRTILTEGLFQNHYIPDREVFQTCFKRVTSCHPWHHLFWQLLSILCSAKAI